MIIKMEKNKTYINITTAVECVLSMKCVDKDERKQTIVNLLRHKLLFRMNVLYLLATWD